MNPLERFSSRVDNYAKYRPGYSPDVISFLRKECQLKPGAIVADVGSGTGIFSQLLLQAGFFVQAVEPNAPMRETAEAALAGEVRFKSSGGQAEATGLADESVDLVVAAQAFHWFDPVKTRVEFLRILRGRSPVVIIWNNRETRSPFGMAFERFLEQHSLDYAEVRARGHAAEESIRDFFKPQPFSRTIFPNEQILDWDQLWGRFLSTSYSPSPGHAKFEPAKTALRELYDKFQEQGVIRMVYETEVFLGFLRKDS